MGQRKGTEKNKQWVKEKGRKKTNNGPKKRDGKKQTMGKRKGTEKNKQWATKYYTEN